MKTIMIEGMGCDHCIGAVTDALETIDGVSSVTVDLENKLATAEVADGVTDATLKDAVENAGYDVMSISE